MGDFGDIFDMFSNEDEENTRSRKQAGSQDVAPDADPKSIIMNKLLKNKPLLIATVVAGIAVLGGAAFLLVKYVGASGAKSIMDMIKPFLN